jgi:tetratricopeptide (TPR) repeat protein
MANETSKQALRRSTDRRYANRWFRGQGIDIGSGTDSLAELTHFFPLMQSVRSWDLPDGDAMRMDGVPDGSYDFVHSSHCLEHLTDPVLGLRNWIRICKEGGHLLITVPDEDLYEQGVWPSTFNPDHKWTFTLSKTRSWSPVCISLTQLLELFDDAVDIVKLELLDAGFRYESLRSDQTRGPFAESAIEMVLRKKSSHAASTVATANAAPVVSALFLQALGHHRAGQDGRAADLYRRVLTIDPTHGSGLSNLALLLEKQHRFSEAIRTLEDLIQARGESAELNYRIARLHECLNATDASLRHFDKALALDPHHALSHVWKGFAHLKSGEYRRGAAGLRWIYRRPASGSSSPQAHPFENAPQDLTGASVVLSADSGLGDTLQFVRYANLLKARGAYVIVECQPELVRLVEQGVRSVDRVVKSGELKPGFDYRIPVTEAIGAFGTTVEIIPNETPYIVPPAHEKAVFQERLREFSGLKVGLVWAGNRDHVADARRSIDPSLLAPLFPVNHVAWFSLQKGASAGGLDRDLVDWTDSLHDMADTAALVSSLDLVISVDSSVAHLAGALGRPVWLLNRHDSCWRWMESRADSPWYPSLRIFRQPSQNDWKAVVDQITCALMALAAASVPRGLDSCAQASTPGVGRAREAALPMTA